MMMALCVETNKKVKKDSPKLNELKEPKMKMSLMKTEIVPRPDEARTKGQNEKDVNPRNNIPIDPKPQINDNAKRKMTYAQVVMMKEDRSRIKCVDGFLDVD